MLVLTRKKDQGVRVYDQEGNYICRIVNLGVDQNRVKLGFESDPKFVLIRDELLEKTEYNLKPPMGQTENDKERL